MEDKQTSIVINKNKKRMIVDNKNNPFIQMDKVKKINEDVKLMRSNFDLLLLRIDDIELRNSLDHEVASIIDKLYYQLNLSENKIRILEYKINNQMYSNGHSTSEHSLIEKEKNIQSITLNEILSSPTDSPIKTENEQMMDIEPNDNNVVKEQMMELVNENENVKKLPELNSINSLSSIQQVTDEYPLQNLPHLPSTIVKDLFQEEKMEEDKIVPTQNKTPLFHMNLRSVSHTINSLNDNNETTQLLDTDENDDCDRTELIPKSRKSKKGKTSKKKSKKRRTEVIQEETIETCISIEPEKIIDIDQQHALAVQYEQQQQKEKKKSCRKHVRELKKRIELNNMLGEGWKVLGNSDMGELDNDCHGEIINYLNEKSSLCFILLNGYDDIIGFQIHGYQSLNDFKEIHNVECSLFTIYDKKEKKYELVMENLSDENHIMIAFSLSGESILKMMINGEQNMLIGVPKEYYSMIRMNFDLIHDERIRNAFKSFVSYQDNDNQMIIQSIMCLSQDFNDNEMIIEPDENDKNDYFNETLMTFIQNDCMKQQWNIVYDSNTISKSISYSSTPFFSQLLGIPHLMICIEQNDSDVICIYIDNKLQNQKHNLLSSKHYIWSSKTDKKYNIKEGLKISFNFHSNNESLFTIGTNDGYLHICKKRSNRSCASNLSRIYTNMTNDELFGMNSIANKFTYKRIVILELIN